MGLNFILLFGELILLLLILIQADKMDDLRTWVRNISDKVMDLEYTRMTKKEWDRSKKNLEMEIERLKKKLNK